MIERISEIIKLNCKILTLLVFTSCTSCVFAQNIDSTDVEQYNLTIDLSKFKTQKLSGIAEIRCKPLNGIKTKSITFMLLKLKVDSVFYKSADSSDYKKMSFSYNDTFIKIQKSLSKLSDIKIYYQGMPIRDAQWGGFYFQGEYAYNLGVAFASNPHNFGRVWFPCIDNFTDKALYTYFIKVPRGYTAVCGGIFKDTLQNTDNTTTWHWQHTNPIPTYLASVAVAPYKLVYDNFIGITKTTPIILAAEGRDTPNLHKSFVNLKKALTTFESFYGPYRFERVGYSLVPFDAGAMEHACNIAYPKSWVNGTLTYETIMAHELSHQWWGDNTTCKSAGDMWLNEGWASYSEALFTESVYGKKAYQDYINDIHREVLQFAHLKDGGATGVNNVSHKNTYGTHVYKKGADMVHCIRGVMGDEAFKDKCKSFMETYKMANVTNQDFINHFNIPNDYIKQIISDTGFAHFSIFNYTSAKETNGWKTSLNYQQRKKFGHHVYQNMPYEVFVFDKNFKKEVVKLNLGIPLAPVTFNTSFKPEFICFDYDQKFSDAITDDVILTDSTGTYILPYSMMTVNIAQNNDTSLLRIEHNWVYPDNWFNNIPNVIISDQRYWTVDGILDPSFQASAIVTYDGSKSTNYTSGWLDNQLFETHSEDSIVLVYRPNAESNWQVETNIIKTIGSRLDKKGTIKINELKKGQYSFGVYGKPASSGYMPLPDKLKLYPNPANEQLRIEWANTLNPERIEIMNSLGQNVLSIAPGKNATSELINTKSLSNGHYFASVFSADRKRMSGEFVIER